MSELPANYSAHLDELRKRLIIVLISVAVFGIASFLCSGLLIDWVTAPIKKSIPSLYFTSPYEAFLTRLRVSLAGGIILGAPVILTQLWSFVAPGLYDRERRAVVPLALSSAALFLCGICFAYFLVLPFSLSFFLGFQTESLRPLITIEAYVSFFLSLLLSFGCVFLTPIAIVGVVELGIVKTDFFRRRRKVVIVLAFVIAAVLTPTADIVTQCLLALPLWGLFELSVWIGGIIEKRAGRSSRSR